MDLTGFATALYAAAGMETGKAADVAGLLVFTDRMGRRIHVLAFALRGNWKAACAAGIRLGGIAPVAANPEKATIIGLQA